MVYTFRFAMKGTFKTENAKLTLVERSILIRIIRWYNSEFPEQDGIDWLDMKERAAQRAFQFTVPQSLLDKSPAELNYHYSAIMESWNHRAIQEKVEDINYALERGLRVTDTREGPTLGHRSSLQQLDAENRKYLEVLRARSNASTAPGATADEGQGDEGFNILVIEHENTTRSSTRPVSRQVQPDVASDQEAIKEGIAEFIRIRTGERTGPITPRSLLRSSSDGIDNGFQGGVELPLIDPDKLFPKLARSTPSRRNLETSKSYSALPSPFTGAAGKSNGENPRSSPNRQQGGRTLTSDMHTQSAPTLDLENIAFDRAKARVLKRVDGPQNPFVQLIEAQAIAFRSHIDVGSTLEQRQRTPTASRDNKDALLLQSAADVHSIMLRDRVLTGEEWNDVFTNFFSDNQLESLRKIEFSNLDLNLGIVQTIGNRLSFKCRLVDLNISRNNIGDIGVFRLLEAITKSNGENVLLSLNLKKTGLTFANGGLKVLSKFRYLR